MSDDRSNPSDRNRVNILQIKHTHTPMLCSESKMISNRCSVFSLSSRRVYNNMLITLLQYAVFLFLCGPLLDLKT